MYVGPGGACGLCSGSVAIQALNATRNCGLNRRSATRSFWRLLSVNAMYQALKVEASKLRSEMAVRDALVARLRNVADWAMSTREAVFHRAAEYPAQAAAIVTRASRTASQICTIRACPPPLLSWPSCP